MAAPQNTGNTTDPPKGKVTTRYGNTAITRGADIVANGQEGSYNSSNLASRTLKRAQGQQTAEQTRLLEIARAAEQERAYRESQQNNQYFNPRTGGNNTQAPNLYSNLYPDAYDTFGTNEDKNLTPSNRTIQIQQQAEAAKLAKLAKPPIDNWDAGAAIASTILSGADLFLPGPAGVAAGLGSTAIDTYQTYKQEGLGSAIKEGAIGLGTTALGVLPFAGEATGLAKFLSNVGKLSAKVLSSPVASATFVATAGSGALDALKQLSEAKTRQEQIVYGSKLIKALTGAGAVYRSARSTYNDKQVGKLQNKIQTGDATKAGIRTDYTYGQLPQAAPSQYGLHRNQKPQKEARTWSNFYNRKVATGAPTVSSYPIVETQLRQRELFDDNSEALTTIAPTNTGLRAFFLGRGGEERLTALGKRALKENTVLPALEKNARERLATQLLKTNEEGTQYLVSEPLLNSFKRTFEEVNKAKPTKGFGTSPTVYSDKALQAYNTVVPNFTKPLEGSDQDYSLLAKDANTLSQQFGLQSSAKYVKAADEVADLGRAAKENAIREQITLGKAPLPEGANEDFRKAANQQFSLLEPFQLRKPTQEKVNNSPQARTSAEETTIVPQVLEVVEDPIRVSRRNQIPSEGPSSNMVYDMSSTTQTGTVVPRQLPAPEVVRQPDQSSSNTSSEAKRAKDSNRLEASKPVLSLPVYSYETAVSKINEIAKAQKLSDKQLQDFFDKMPPKSTYSDLANELETVYYPKSKEVGSVEKAPEAQVLAVEEQVTPQVTLPLRQAIQTGTNPNIVPTFQPAAPYTASIVTSPVDVPNSVPLVTGQTIDPNRPNILGSSLEATPLQATKVIVQPTVPQGIIIKSKPNLVRMNAAKLAKDRIEASKLSRVKLKEKESIPEENNLQGVFSRLGNFFKGRPKVQSKRDGGLIKPQSFSVGSVESYSDGRTISYPEDKPKFSLRKKRSIVASTSGPDEEILLTPDQARRTTTTKPTLSTVPFIPDGYNRHQLNMEEKSFNPDQEDLPIKSSVLTPSLNRTSYANPDVSSSVAKSNVNGSSPNFLKYANAAIALPFAAQSFAQGFRQAPQMPSYVAPPRIGAATIDTTNMTGLANRNIAGLNRTLRTNNYADASLNQMGRLAASSAGVQGFNDLNASVLGATNQNRAAQVAANNANNQAQYQAQQQYNQAAYDRDLGFYNASKAQASQGLNVMQQVNSNLYNVGVQEKTADNAMKGSMMTSLGNQWLEMRKSGGAGLAPDELNDQDLYIRRNYQKRMEAFKNMSSTYSRGGSISLKRSDTTNLTPAKIGLELAKVASNFEMASNRNSIQAFSKAVALAVRTLELLKSK